MNMKGMTKKKMGGFMCHSPAATAVCITPDSRSAIVPGRRLVPADRYVTATTTSGDRHINGRLFTTAKYSKLVHHHHQHDHHSQRKLINNTSTTSTNSAHNKSVVLPASLIKGPQKASRINGDHDHYRQQRPPKPPQLMINSVPDNVFQVVVMRVSLHCQGCAGKLKKHLSKMEGVTSFSIELETKRVTVMGHVSPVGVLESISKVRRAEFWPSACSATE
ncbi:uncharacterized protein LOC133782057 [Humulus lupulus]|uniref:uncharacterized protein LOC133782057 n=1 Tax=Humulus lupulus TaxID=3486 RepID=UPI002B416AA7|nr:uncharacterized protein LOC133782057 [Humulus lupulus]